MDNGEQERRRTEKEGKITRKETERAKKTCHNKHMNNDTCETERIDEERNEYEKENRDSSGKQNKDAGKIMIKAGVEA